jgi:hypothetical protein
MNVELRIERLVLEGLDVTAGSRREVRAAVQDSLTRLLRDGRLSDQIARGGAIGALRAADIQLGGGPAELGEEIGRALYRRIGDG